MQDGSGEHVEANAAPEAIAAEGPATRKARSFPGFWQAVLLLGLSLILQIFLTIPFFILGFFGQPVSMAVPPLLATAVIIALFYRMTGSRCAEVFPFAYVSGKVLFALLLAVAGLFILRLEIAKLLTWIFPPPAWFSQFLREMVRSGRNPWGAFVAGGIVIPVVEEMLFRGLILHGFVARYGVRTAIFASSFLFALLHGNPWQFVTALCLGILFAWCAVETRSLIPCLLGHVANNSIGFIITGLKLQLPGSTSDPARGIVFHPWWLNAAALLATVLGIFLLIRNSTSGSGTKLKFQPKGFDLI